MIGTTQSWRSRHLSRRPAASFAALVVCVIVILVAAPQAQQSPVFTPAAVAGGGTDTTTATNIDLLVGRSTVLNVGTAITRVSLTVPDVADALVTGPTQLLIHGKQPGTISLFVWDRGGAIRTYEVNVRRDLSALSAYLKQLFPGETITVLGSGKDVVLSGTVSGQYVIDKAADVAGGYVEKKENVVNLLKQQEGVASNQVMLRVRFAEVSRSALQELGASLFANARNEKWFGRTAPPGVPAPQFEDGKLVFSDFLNFFVFNSKEGLGGVVRALATKGLFQSLAEPNLIATNGKEASFLAGGEYPYPVAQTSTGGTSITIQFKEFGIRLNFTPTVLGGDMIHLKVRPEVSALDFSNAVVLEGFRIPALTTRRTETEVELRDGQTFAIAGLMNNTLTNSMSKIPGIGDIPILGLLFRSRAHQKNQTELVVMITPTIIRRGQMGVSEGLPNPIEPYLGRPDKVAPNPDAYVGSPRYPLTQSPRGGGDNEQPAPEPLPSRPVNDSSAKLPAPPAAAASMPVGAPVVTPRAPAPSSSPTPAPKTPAPVRTPQPQAVAPGAQTHPPAMPQAQATVAPPGATPSAATPAGATPAGATPAGATVSVQEPAAPPKPTKEELRAIEKAREKEKKAAADAAREAEAARKREADEQKAAAKKAEADRRQAEKIEKERAKRQAEVDRRNAEIARKQAEKDQKREKALTDAAERLKEAQAAYQAEVEKTKGGRDEKKSPEGSAPSGTRK